MSVLILSYTSKPLCHASCVFQLFSWCSNIFCTWNASFKLKELHVIWHKGACRMRAQQANHWFPQHPRKKISQYLKGCIEKELNWHLIDCKILLANYFPLLSIRKENLYEIKSYRGSFPWMPSFVDYQALLGWVSYTYQCKEVTL